MKLTDEELDFFKEVFTDEPLIYNSGEVQHELSVRTNVPKNLASVLGNAKLTLLAEISHYQLWFPLTLTYDEKGEFSPQIGIPEIIDIQGNERSWRVNTPENVTLQAENTPQGFEVLSLSSTGLTLRADCPEKAQELFKQKEMSLTLPDQKQVSLILDMVPRSDGVIAARFKQIDQGREALRKLLFSLHRSEYSSLYSGFKQAN